MYQALLLYSWRFSHCSVPIHWLDHGHMTSNNETVSRQMPWAGNIAKTMTSNGEQFTVTCEMLTAVARDCWNFSTVFKFCFCLVLLYNKSLNDWSLGEQWILFLDPSLSVYCFMARGGIVSVVCSIVLSKGSKPFTWDLTRAAAWNSRDGGLREASTVVTQ